ncbi:hypothetical protein QBC42DRAFT_2398 [Cladorrhinum samala]|uniref:Uncharacterized protein n=1 Tax=Cladorrhinum samala TaxID=585594 RepID=A0AAV9I6V5_9PEZI|nr:hypothetical protein QBC42DRAFT_2398 [Cladorrhinum samala]
MDHFSTVLQRPPQFDEDGSHSTANEDRGPRGGGLRDILNPVSSSNNAPSSVSASQPPGTPRAPAPPRPQSSFGLRSPTQGDYRTPNPYATSPGNQTSTSRSILSNPFATASAPSLPPPPPPLQAPPALASPPAVVSSVLQQPSRVYYSTEIRDREPAREKTPSSRFYDPTSDTKSDRDLDRQREREGRVSDTGSSWRNATQSSTPKVSKLWAPHLQLPFHSMQGSHIVLLKHKLAPIACFHLSCCHRVCFTIKIISSRTSLLSTRANFHGGSHFTSLQILIEPPLPRSSPIVPHLTDANLIFFSHATLGSRLVQLFTILIRVLQHQQYKRCKLCIAKPHRPPPASSATTTRYGIHQPDFPFDT